MKHFSICAAGRKLAACMLAASLCIMNAGFAPCAFAVEADDGSASDAYVQAAADSGLYPSEEELEAWKADGTLEERIAFQEALGNHQVSPQLIGQMQQGEAGAYGLRNNLPASMLAYSSMPTTGNANVVALLVSFPAESDQSEPSAFAEGDTLEALQNLIGNPLGGDSSSANPNAAYAPYDSLSAYYGRSSYGALNVSGTAFEYTAQHPRSYYTDDPDVLFAEALTSLDDTVDFNSYDGNNDGCLDAVYLHFAGETTGWGSTWWSNEKFYTGVPVSLDGKNIGGTVLLHHPSNTADGLNTAIHETGHLLGLPDYYSYDTGYAKQDPSGRTGILTFDMMNNNIGDHNAFSKWLLGWIDESKITRIVANETGVTVKRGTSEPVAVDPDESGKVVAQASLDLLATDDPSSCGGFIAVSDDEALLDSTDLFSSFYLLEYNGTAGNQVVSYYSTWDTTEPLPEGFRLFRIQADMNEDGDGLIHSNSSDDVHNQLIELVDHDGSEYHTQFTGAADGAVTPEYGCMMMEGDVVTPEGYPSTNFQENINVGFTGLNIAVTESSATRGAIEVSSSIDMKPSLSPDSITLTPDISRNVLGIDSISLAANTKLVEADDAESPYVCIDGMCKSVYANINGKTARINYEFPPELFAEGKTCEVVFPAGYFLVGKVDGQKIYSSEIRVSLPVGKVAQFKEAGYYDGSISDTYTATDVFACEDGSRNFVVKNGASLNLCTVNPGDPTKVNTRQISGIDEADTYDFDAVPTQGDEFCLLATSYPGGERTRTAYWVSTKDARVKASSNVSAEDCEAFGAAGDALIMASIVQDGETYEPSLDLQVVKPAGSGADARVHAWVVQGAKKVIGVDGAPGCLAITGNDPDSGALVARVIDVANMLEDAEASGAETLAFGEAPAVSTLDISSFSGLSALAVTNSGYLGATYNEPAAVGSPGLSDASEDESAGPLEENAQGQVFSWENGITHEGSLTSFNERGDVTDSALIAAYESGGLEFKKVSVSSNGVPAVEAALNPEFDTSRLTMLFENGMNAKPTMLSNSLATSGIWLQNGAWLEAGWNHAASELFEEGDPSSADPSVPKKVRYLITAELGEGSNGGDGNGDTDGGEAGDGVDAESATPGASDGVSNASDADAHSFAKTGDPHAIAFVGLVLAAATAAFGIVLSARMQRKH